VSQARAGFQARITVCIDMFMTAAVSSIVRPPKELLDDWFEELKARVPARWQACLRDFVSSPGSSRSLRSRAAA
jgi:hypothetical protein